jgi:alpha-tubulin suppressor-like RCC1 family protein
MLAVGSDFIVCCLSDGVVRAWGGNNEYGQLNVPEEVGTIKHLSAGNGFVIATREDGTLIGWGRNDKGQLNIPEGLIDIAYTAAGDDFVYAVKNDSSLICWGSPLRSQLIIPADVQQKGVKTISVNNTVVAIETNQGSITTFDTK